MTTSSQPDPDRCPICGNSNGCQLCDVGGHKGPCWCARTSIPDSLLARVPLELRNRSCLCQSCVTAFWHDHEQANARPQPIGAGDFYFDQNGLIAFTADYHLRRGYCCGSGCRHCPYRTTE